MSDIMRPVPFDELLHRVFRECSEHESIFNIPIEEFYHHDQDHALRILDQSCATCVGPAAGPHTQLAQNIISSYLTGGRFIELKTVQKLDTLEIDKPCIDARDEGYNVEWSTEFTLEKAYDEYVKAWVLLHLLEELITGRRIETPSFIFNMSVGYDLEGIKTEKMQRYIDSMTDSSSHPVFISYLEKIEQVVAEDKLLQGLPFEVDRASLEGISKRISSCISPSVTLSTMHGCPPKEIEAICSYMLEQKGINTFVKLNPTLLGYEKVRKILDGLGYEYLHLSEESFSHDLQYDDAIQMLTRLIALAKSKGRKFGVKLTNTLGSVNDQGHLPGQEMYMSGRALFPISINVAAKLSKQFDGKLPISYSGGAQMANIAEIFSCGIYPITLATDLLKPGGYARLKQLAETCDSCDGWERKTIDVKRLSALAEAAVSSDYLQKQARGTDVITTGEPLPVFDCYVAPCTVACPIGQDVPEYVYLVGQGEYAQALELIYEKNALPHITGHICDHQCMFNCTRLDYEGAVQIRRMKRIAVENGFEEYISEWERPESSDVKAAVIGAGPAGLSAAYFLARSGFEVEVFEQQKDAGGVVRYVIPEFRLPVEAIEADVEFIKRHGVTFHYGVESQSVSIETLREKGFEYLFYAVGASKENDLPLPGSRIKTIPALDFLHTYREDPSKATLGEHVVVVGGGNTAMDSARAAMTVPGVKSVDVLYRRSKQQMPADLEEYDNAVAQGAQFHFLSNPEGVDEQGQLIVRVMELGQEDSSGRARPVATDRSYTMNADVVIAAIGERVDALLLEQLGIGMASSGWAKVDENLKTETDGVYLIGDASSGPSTVVQCIASARKAVDAAIEDILGPIEDEHDHEHDHEHEEEEYSQEELLALERAEDEFFAEISQKKGVIKPPALEGQDDAEFARIEAARCLECSYICNKCVEVCPNRANVAIDVRAAGLFENPYQIVHVDAYCNECGNCATFCPWEGRPYKDKITIFSSLEDMKDSTNAGFCLVGDSLHIRLAGAPEVLDLQQAQATEKITDLKTQVLIETILEEYAYLLRPVGN